MSIALFNPLEQIIRDFLGHKEEPGKHVEQADENLCSICMCEITDPVNYCRELHQGTCKECIKSFISMHLAEAYAGSCPILWCPVCKAVKVNRVLQFSNWKIEKQLESSYKKYMTLASSVVYMKCRGCHSNRDMLVAHQICPDIIFNQEYTTDLHKYETGVYTIEEYYKKLVDEYLPNFNTKICAKDKATPYMKKYGESSTNDFHFVLSTIDNPERRMNLQLRYYRDYPKVLTLCCGREHCFKCKTVFHTGKTCIEIETSKNKETVDNDVLECPQCNLSLVKGDGCSTIHCVCGKEFNWNSEKERIVYVKRFLEKYNAEVKCGNTTSNIHDYCAKCAWTQNDVLALNWLRKNVEAVESIRRLLSHEFGFYVIHVVAQLGSTNYPNIGQNKRECMEILTNFIRRKYAKLYDTLVNNNSAEIEFEYMLKSLNDKQKYQKSLDILNERNIFDKIALSAIEWISSHKNYIQSQYANLVNLSLRQFRYTDSYSKIYYGTPSNFKKFQSDSGLLTTFVASSTTNFSFKVEQRVPITINVKNICSEFYIGINPGRDGCYTGLKFGSSSITLYHENSGGRGDGGGGDTPINYRYNKESVFTMILTGDDVKQQLRICVNNGEIVFKFDITDHPNFNDIKWVITARRETVTIINNPSKYWDTYRFQTWQIVLKEMQQVVKNINDENYDFQINGIFESFSTASKYHQSSDKYIMNISIAKHVIDLIEDYFNQLESAPEEIKDMTWNDVIYTMIWYANHIKTIQTESDEDMATRFLMNNIDDPAFAAILTVHGIKTGPKDEMKCARAYMRCNPEFVDFAYQIDSENPDPIVSGLKSGCRCIPRCSRRVECPTCSPSSSPPVEEEHNGAEVEEDEEENDEPPQTEIEILNSTTGSSVQPVIEDPEPDPDENPTFRYPPYEPADGEEEEEVEVEVEVEVEEDGIVTSHHIIENPEEARLVEEEPEDSGSVPIIEEPEEIVAYVEEYDMLPHLVEEPEVNHYQGFARIDNARLKLRYTSVNETNAGADINENTVADINENTNENTVGEHIIIMSPEGRLRIKTGKIRGSMIGMRGDFCGRRVVSGSSLAETQPDNDDTMEEVD